MIPSPPLSLPFPLVPGREKCWTNIFFFNIQGCYKSIQKKVNSWNGFLAQNRRERGTLWLKILFCMWSLNISSNKCSIATLGQKWLLPWFLRGASEAPPHGSHRIWYPIGCMVNPYYFGVGCGWGLGGHHPLLESAIFLEPNIVLTLDKSVHSIVIIVQ